MFICVFSGAITKKSETRGDFVEDGWATSCRLVEDGWAISCRLVEDGWAISCRLVEDGWAISCRLVEDGWATSCRLGPWRLLCVTREYNMILVVKS